jgi:hypothetical protein
MALGKISGCSHERVVDSDHVEFAAQLVDRSDRGPQRACIDASTTLRGGRGGACLGIDQLAGDERLCAVPQLDGDV